MNMNRQTRPDFVDYSILVGSTLGFACCLGVLASLLSGCSESHDPREGTIVCIDARRDCPSGWVCEENYCWSQPAVADAGPPTDDAMPIDSDGGRPDVHLPPPPDGSPFIPDGGMCLASFDYPRDVWTPAPITSAIEPSTCSMIVDAQMMLRSDTCELGIRTSWSCGEGLEQLEVFRPWSFDHADDYSFTISGSAWSCGTWTCDLQYDPTEPGYFDLSCSRASDGATCETHFAR